MTVSDAQRQKERERESNSLRPACRSYARRRSAEGFAVAKVGCPLAGEVFQALVTLRAMGIFITRACGLLGMSRSLVHYE